MNCFPTASFNDGFTRAGVRVRPPVIGRAVSAALPRGPAARVYPVPRSVLLSLCACKARRRQSLIARQLRGTLLYQPCGICVLEYFFLISFNPLLLYLASSLFFLLFFWSSFNWQYFSNIVYFPTNQYSNVLYGSRMYRLVLKRHATAKTQS